MKIYEIYINGQLYYTTTDAKDAFEACVEQYGKQITMKVNGEVVF